MTQEIEGDLTWVWPMLGWCIMTLASARLKASVRFLSLRGMYQKGGTCKACDSQTEQSRLRAVRSGGHDGRPSDRVVAAATSRSGGPRTDGRMGVRHAT